MMDVTPAYTDAFASSAASADRAAKLLQGHRVILVRGFLSEAVLKIGSLFRFPKKLQIVEAVEKVAPGFFSKKRSEPESLPFGEYFDEQERWLGSQGIQHEAIDIESEASVAVNGARIHPLLKDPSKPILIVSHSKGCLDVLDALLRLRDEERKNIKGWVAIQGPFQGTPIADVIVRNPELKEEAGKLLEAAGGSVQSLVDMQPISRAQYHSDHKIGIESVLKQIPTICLGSSVDSNHLLDTFLAVPYLLIKRYGAEKNDGLVPVPSALLAGARGCVTLDGVDHAMPVMRSFGEFARLDATRALLCCLAQEPTGN